MVRLQHLLLAAALMLAPLAALAVDPSKSIGDPWFDSLVGQVGDTVEDSEPPLFDPDDYKDDSAGPGAGTGTGTGQGGSPPAAGGDPNAGPDAGADPSRPDQIDPRHPRVSALIDEWIRIAEPPPNGLYGAQLRYTPWGVMVGLFKWHYNGQVRSATGRATAKPDDAGPVSQVYVWGKAAKLDSVNHCTLREFVLKRLAEESIAHCKGRYQPMPLVTLPDPKVPQVVGLDIASARAQLKSSGFKASVEAGSAAPSTDREGKVEAQKPAPGTSLKRGGVVALRVYAAPRPVMPSVIGKSLGEAQAELGQLGMQVQVEYGDSAPTPDKTGRVQAQKPPPGRVVGAGEQAAVRLYTPAVQAIAVPKVTGLPSATAIAQLHASGLDAELLPGDPAPSAQANGQIYAQRPAPGVSAAQGSTVQLRVYTQNTQINVPTVTGMQASQARAELAQANLQASILPGTPAPDPSKTGVVHAQTPAANSVAQAGSTVLLTVHTPPGSPPATPPVATPPSVTGGTGAGGTSGFTPCGPSPLTSSRLLSPDNLVKRGQWAHVAPLVGKEQEAGVQIQSGLFMHPGNDGPTEAVFNHDCSDVTLTGIAAVLDKIDYAGRNGSVVFIIKGDGRELWRSNTVRQNGPNENFSVSLGGVQELRLITTDSGNGTGEDWAAWLNIQIGGAGAAPPAIDRPADQTISCNNAAKAGQTRPERVDVTVGSTRQVTLKYETYSAEDQIIVRYAGQAIWNSGCVGTRGWRQQQLSLSGASQTMTVEMHPKCDPKDSGTAWKFEVQCGQ